MLSSAGVKLKDFSEVTPEAVADFFCKQLPKAQLIAAAEGLLEKHETHEKFYANGGKYLPLKAWKRKGFNIKRIKKNSLPDDIQENRVIQMKLWKAAICSEPKHCITS